MITCMSDVGLGLGQLGPTHSFSEIPVFSKWFLAFVMIVGRLEVYSVLLLFTPEFLEKIIMPFKSEINFKLVSRLIGNLLLVESATMLFVLVITLLFNEDDGRYFIYSSLIALALALLMILFGRNAPARAGKRRFHDCNICLGILFGYRSIAFLDERGHPFLHQCLFRNHVRLYYYRSINSG